jgi:hypothetical protein
MGRGAAPARERAGARRAPKRTASERRDPCCEIKILDSSTWDGPGAVDYEARVDLEAVREAGVQRTLGAMWNGYYSDIGRTVVCGRPGRRQQEVYTAVHARRRSSCARG